MKTRNLILLILLTIPLGAVTFAQGIYMPSDWEVISTGIEFQQYRLTNPVPVNIFVARMSRDNLNVTIESSIAQGQLSGGIETVSGMADRYDQALNYWGPPTDQVSQTWGSRNDVVVAINGFYYGGYEEPPGVPWSGQIHSGWYAKRYNDFESSSGFVWKMDREAFIGGCISHPDNKQYVHIDSSTQLDIDGINKTRGDNQLIIYTSQYDRDTKTDNEGTEILVEMSAPAYISIASNMPVGIVREIRTNSGSTPIPFDHIILSGTGQAAQELVNYLEVDDPIGIAQRVVDCTSEPADNDWTKSYAGVGGHWRFLRNGVIYPYTNDDQAVVRDPRTAIAYNKDRIFFIVADGRNPGVSEGMTVAEMGDFVKNTLSATDAIMQDGGGSSTMAIKRQGVGNTFQVVNNTFCNNVSCNYKVYLPLVIDSSASLADSTSQSPASESNIEWDATTQTLQRLVANGMMMIVVEPIEKSETYSPGSLVATISEAGLYLGPGTNYNILTSISSDSTGEVVAHTNGLDGILAKDANWWQVDFGEEIGWVSEESLIGQLKSAPADWRKNVNPLR